MNIDELNAIHTMYDKKLTKKNVFVMALYPAIFLPVMLFTVFWRWWLVPVGFGLGLLYGLTVMIPVRIQSGYKYNAFKERNRFVNNLSQSLHRKSITMLDALTDVAEFRLRGELKDDIHQLAYNVAGKDAADRLKAYNDLIDKYNHDRIFVQYIEHLITIDISGMEDLAVLDETAEAHDASLQWQDYLIRKKKESLLYYITNMLLSYVLSVVVITLTWDVYVDFFAHTILGLLFGGIYLAMTFYFSHRFVLDYNDEEIMEVKF